MNREQKHASLVAEREQQRKRDDLHMLKHPDFWPRWPSLPVKERHHKPGETPLCGFVYADGKPRVYIGNLFAISDEAKKREARGEKLTWGEVLATCVQHESYPDFETLIEHWEVD